MEPRNRTVDSESEQQQQSQPSLQPDNNNNIPPVVANIPNLEAQSLQDPAYHNSAMFYGPPQYHHQNAPTNFYLPYVAFQAPPSQLPSSSSHGVADHEYERNAHFMDHTRGAFKRKHTEGPGHPLVAPFNRPETVAPFGGARNRPYPPNSFVQGNYAGHHPFPPPGSIWYNQHHVRSNGSPSFWPHAPHFHGSNHTPFMYPSQLNPRGHYYSHYHHHPRVTLYPHMASSASYRVPPGSFAHLNTMNNGLLGSEMGLSHVGPVQPTGFRIYQHHQRDDYVPVATLRQHHGGVPRLRMMPDDEVAIIEFGDFLGGSGNNHVDHHQDMRLDIEEMSYEELLALTERIGTVNIGVSEEDVKNYLKTRTRFGIKSKEDSSSSPSQEPCPICLESFEKEEKIARLDCGHEYHVECLEKWLILKKVCPICKAEVLVMEKSNS